MSKNKSKILLYFVFTIFIIGAILFLTFEQKIEKIQAGTGDNVTGFAWSENIGWVSFNNTSGGGGVNYGVDIGSDGIFSGYAWSRGTDADVGGVGWLSFNQADLVGCPSGTCQAKLDLGNYEVSGWARVLAYGGGWDGWIKLRGANYGVKLNSSTKEFEGWAWGDQVVGWLSFNCNNPETGDVCGTSDYQVKTSYSLPSTATDLSVSQGDYCAVPLHPIFSWTFSDSDPGDTQGSYQVQADNNSNFSSPEVDSGKVSSASESYYSPTPLSYNTTYYWRLKVWDNYDTESNWVSGPSFTTPSHAYPDPNFSRFPSSPNQGEVIQFCAVQEPGVCPEDKSTCYSVGGSIPPPSCSGKTFLWTFPVGSEFATGTSSTSENPRVKFNSTGVKSVSLEITDEVGSCSRTKTVGVMLPLPKWREVAP